MATESRTKAADLPAPRTPIRNEPYKSTGEDYRVMGIEGSMSGTKLIFHATGDQTGGSCVLYEVHWQPGDASEHHLHRLEDEGFYVVEGQFTLHAPDGEMTLQPGEWGWAPRNIRHGYSVGPEGARVLCFQVPGSPLPEFFKIMADRGWAGGIEGYTGKELVDFNAWAEGNFGFTLYDPVEYPPGQTVLDPEYQDQADA
jgi:quercetin dioxygenase-like cupin family protein